MKFLSIKITFLFTIIFSICQNAECWETFLQESTTDSSVEISHNSSTVSNPQQSGIRSRESIINVVKSHSNTVTKLYDKHLTKKNKLAGEIKTKFVIDESGNVISSQIVESSMKDSTFEAELLTEINSWVFNKIDKERDSTEVVYPFFFKPDQSKTVVALLAILSIIISTVLMISQNLPKS